MLGAPEAEGGVEDIVLVAHEADIGLAELVAYILCGCPAAFCGVGLERARILEGAAVCADEGMEIALAVQRDAGGVVDVVGGRPEADEGRGGELACFMVVGCHECRDADDALVIGVGRLGPDEVSSVFKGDDCTRDSRMQRDAEAELGDVNRRQETDFAVFLDGDGEIHVVFRAPEGLPGARPRVAVLVDDDGRRSWGHVVACEGLDVDAAVDG